MVGIIEKPEHITTQWFKDEGDEIFLLGDVVDADDLLKGLGGSAYLQVRKKLKTGTPPRCDLKAEKTLHDAVRNVIREGLVKSAHDCSEGGLAVALAESCISQSKGRLTPLLIGAEIDLSSFDAERLDALLFGESQGRIIVSVSPDKAASLVESLKSTGCPVTKLGCVGGSELAITMKSGATRWSTDKLHDIWWNSIARAMNP